MMTNLLRSAFAANKLFSTIARLRLLLVMFLTLTSSTAWGATDTFTCSTPSNATSPITGTSENGYFTVSHSQAGASNWYTTSANHWRVYEDATVTITPKAGVKITKIEMTVSSNSYPASRLGCPWEGEEEDPIVLTATAQCRPTKITVTYEEASTDPYTVKFYKTSTTFESVTEKSAGAGVNPPTMEEKCGEWTFQGWSKLPSNSETSTTKLDLVVTLDEEIYYPTKNIDLYPVYTKSEGGGGTAYTKVTTISEGVYVMVSEKTSGTYKYMPNTTSSSANPTLGSGITTSTTNGITSLTNEVTDAMLWDFTSTGTTNQFYLRPHGSTTIGLGCTTSTGANIRISSTYKDVKWTITTSSSYGWQFKSNASSAMYLAVYSDSNWRNYTSSTTNQNGKFHLFKQTSSSTTYYFSYPQCTTETTVCLVHKYGRARYGLVPDGNGVLTVW